MPHTCVCGASPGEQHRANCPNNDATDKILRVLKRIKERGHEGFHREQDTDCMCGKCCSGLVEVLMDTMREDRDARDNVAP